MSNNDGWVELLVGPVTTPSFQSIIGIAVAITGNVVISFALNCQKLAHKKLEQDRNGGGGENEGTKKPQAPDVERGIAPPSQLAPSPEIPINGELQPLLLQSDRRSYSQPQTASSPGAILPLSTTPPTRSAFATQAGSRSPSVRMKRGAANANATGSVAGTIPEEAMVVVPDPGPAGLRERTISWIDEDARPKIVLGSTGNGANSLRPPQQQQQENGGSGAESPSGRFQNADQETAYLKSKLWWLGFLLLNIGEMGNFLSYAFAPASVVAPLGTFALVANCFFAPLMLKEQFRKRDLLGIAVAIVGAITVVIASKSSDVRLGPHELFEAIKRPPFAIYASIAVVTTIVLAVLSERPIGQEVVYIDVGLCALFGGFTVLSTKGFSTLLSLEGLNIFREWITYPLIVVLIGTGVGQVRYLNRALMSFDSKIVVPTQFVLFTLAAIVGSAILYRDFDNISAYRFIIFLYGVATTFVGVLILTRPDIQLAPDAPAEVGPPDFSTPTIHNVNLPNTYTPLRTIRIPPGTPVIRHRGSRASLSLSPGFLLLAASPAGPPPHFPPSSPTGSSVPLPRSRTRSESRGRGQSERTEGTSISGESARPTSLRF
ncbi:hypothetical protein FRB90_001631 [Tulasnella sp. 427]|nr:hypothetical protein FRB90_001631 [Tulasnella sp. 427]